LKIFGLHRLDSRSDRLTINLLAVVLPVLSSIITARIRFLHHTPFALHVLCIIFVAMIGGLWPAVIAVVFSIVSSYYLVIDASGFSEPFWVTALRCSVLMVIGIFVAVMNSSRRRALNALKDRTAELILSQQGSRCASWRFDPRDKLRWQRGGYEVFGIPFDELEALPSPIDLMHPEDQAGVRSAIDEAIRTNGPIHVQYRVLFPNGDVHWNEGRGAPIAPGIAIWRGVTFDVSERKLAENALLRSEKLAAMGRLASTVAHEINNPLEAVTNLLYLARTSLSHTDDSQAYLASAEAELARLADITRLTLGFVRNNATSRNIDPSATIDEVLSIFRHRFELKRIQVARSCQGGLLIHIAPHELRQVLTNIISNAADALPDSGATLSIKVRQENTSAIIQIEDNGHGISEADILRIFEPFFSTKPDVGTGIGLWVTRELVEKSGGTISVRSGDLPGGMKTSFRVEFPLATAQNS
jgi:signal transduction histidine kinase